MKAYIIFYLTIFSFLSSQSWAQSKTDFFFKPAVSLEYSAPTISSGGANVDLKTNNFGKQVSGIENFAFGANFRVHKNLGFNINWAQSALHNNKLQDFGTLSQEARFKIDHYNFSLLSYFIIDNNFELFAEAGIADMNSSLRYVTNSGNAVSRKAHETKAIYGAGFQVKIGDNNQDSIRFSFQKYAGKLALLDSNYTTVRIGYLKSF